VPIRFYVLPKATNDLGAIAPKYLSENAVTSWQSMDYGLENAFLVGADVTSAQHTALSAQLDVIAIPLALDNTIAPSALSTVQSRLEGMNIPANWVTTSHTYRDVVRITAKVFQFMQRFHARQLRSFFQAGMTLDTQWNALTQAQKAALKDVADSFSPPLDTTGITSTSTLRDILRTVVQQLPSSVLMGETF
jgi:hypothetical protein